MRISIITNETDISNNNTAGTITYRLHIWIVLMLELSDSMLRHISLTPN